MSYHTQYNLVDHLIEVQFHGHVTLAELQAASAEATRLSEEQRCFWLLGDLRAATHLALSLIAIYQLPHLIAKSAIAIGLQPARYKRAIVYKPAQGSQAKFLETVMINRAHNVRIFQDVDEAKAWLMQE